MSNCPAPQLAFLRELLKKGFHQENLDKLAQCCAALAQDSSYVLPFFVLRCVFRGMSSVWDGEAVDPVRYYDLACDLNEPVLHLLDKIANDEVIGAEELEAVVRIHLRNASVFRSGGS